MQSTRSFDRARRGAWLAFLGALLLGCGAGLVACGDSDVADAPAPPVGAGAPASRALWVLAEGSRRVLEHPERIPLLIEDASLLGVTDLFVQVYRGGRAWYDSDRADAAPYRALRERTSLDTLADLVERAHAADLRVHAWVNVLSLARNRDAPVVRALGPDAVLVDRRGRSLLDYPKLDVPPPDRRYYRMGTPAVYLDPAAPGVADWVAGTYAELLARYPQLDGLHLDYIRYPDVLPVSPGSRFGVGLDFGYGERTRERFRRETDLEAPFGDSLANANRWDAWRRDAVTEVVREIRRQVLAVKPEAVMSAAVWTWADRAYLAQGQDWRRWLEEDLVELAVPMSYTVDDRLFRYQVEHFARLPLANRIWIGLGSWLFAKQPARALAQIRIARDAGAAGEALFSYDSIVAAPALREALLAEAQGGR